MNTLKSTSTHWTKTTDLNANVILILKFLVVGIVLLAWLASSFVVYMLGLESIFQEAPGGFFMGIYLSRWAILALLLVMMPGNVIVRGSLALLLFAFEPFLFFVIHSDELILPTFLFLPTVLLAIGIPFEFARIWFNGRLRVEWFDSLENQPLAIKGLFLRMTGIAIFLGVIRCCEFSAIANLLGIGAFLFMSTTLFLIPITIKTSKPRLRWLWFLAFPFFVLLVTGVAGFFIGNVVLEFEDEDVVTTQLGMCGFLLTYCFALFALRLLGIKAEFGKERPKSAARIPSSV